MSYKIKNVVIQGSTIRVFVSFHGGLYEGSTTFPDSIDEAGILAKLDIIEAGYKSEAQIKDVLPEKLKNLIGYVKA